ncbi:MAG TPA: non-canonical purine NTP pyrophosphatase [Candidatus Diapherotrites archaeon]|uniref:Non-canonical purine NTP pyrophosphatase n=1 Tax=Candidatus Iainarchaeum sp. TaxID=3101447 RepID=A0A7J4IZK2_9ARCH|nr:non-canonical purine NTP pyrophosphatase [Candidatus Diapherotrites archaeon]
MELFIATTNKHKVEEISRILSAHKIALRHRELKIIEPDFDSLEEIAAEKARQAYETLRAPVIAEDTGVYFDAYRNFPGTLAKRVFLGLGFEGLLLLIRSAKTKRAHFSTVICYHDGKESRCFSGELGGTLLQELVSVEKDRLPYEKLFVPDGHSAALVDLPIEEKNKISHRGKAAAKLAKWLVSKGKK